MSQRELCLKHKKAFDAKTIDKLDNLKSLVGKAICIRPDYESITIERQYVEPELNTPVHERFIITHGDVLTVVKTRKGGLGNKKPEITVMRNNEMKR